jgi:hypothetical protein
MNSVLSCEHTDKERMLEGTWVSLEVYKAIEMDYKLVRIDEVWHWDKFTEDIFKAYINFAIRGKQQESGWPEDCVTNE